MPELLFDKAGQARIVQAIREAEKNTSGEIKVHVEKKCPTRNALERSKQVFFKLKLQETQLRNGVLFYLATDNRKFAILGDEGIFAVIPKDFWDEIKQQMQVRFREKQFVEGLCEGIRKAGEQLKTHFPYQSDDINEISDEISFG
jgi:uncharacterized membrane protein